MCYVSEPINFNTHDVYKRIISKSYCAAPHGSPEWNGTISPHLEKPQVIKMINNNDYRMLRYPFLKLVMSNVYNLEKCNFMRHVIESCMLSACGYGYSETFASYCLVELSLDGAVGEYCVMRVGQHHTVGRFVAQTCDVIIDTTDKTVVFGTHNINNLYAPRILYGGDYNNWPRISCLNRIRVCKGKDENTFVFPLQKSLRYNISARLREIIETTVTCFDDLVAMSSHVTVNGAYPESDAIATLTRFMDAMGSIRTRTLYGNV